NGGGERAARARFERVAEMLRCAGASRCDHRYRHRLDDIPRVLDIVPRAHAVIAHAVEHDLARPAPGRLAHPLQRFHAAVARCLRTAGILLRAVRASVEEAVDSEHDALAAEIARE